MSELEIKMEKMKTLTINDETFDIIDDGAVRFDKLQNLTDAEKAQARKKYWCGDCRGCCCRTS